MKRLLFAVGLGLWAGAASAQEPAAATHEPAAAAQNGFHVACPQGEEGGDIVMPHIVDSKHFELPWPCSWQHWGVEVSFPTWNVQLPVVGTIDLAPTKHVFFLFVAATLTALLLVGTARAHEASTRAVGHPKGLAASIEAVMLYLRNEVYMPVIGHGGEKYIPFVLTLFFFIYICNVLGLLPYGATATGNVNVTAALAVITFFVVEIAGIRALGKGYLGTIIYWPHDMPLLMKLPLTLVMTPIELVGKFTKPFALTIRLFANMIAGHIVILSLISLIFINVWVALGAVPMALFIMFLELLVTLIQAFIFSLLAAVFIGQIRTAHH